MVLNMCTLVPATAIYQTKCLCLALSALFCSSGCCPMILHYSLVTSYLPLIQKYSNTHMQGLAVYVKERLPFAWDLSLENSADSHLCFQLALLHSLSYFFFLYQPPYSSLCRVFDSISSRDFNINHKDRLTYSGGTDRPIELTYNFSISNDLTQLVNFPTWIPDYDSHSPALLDLFIS